MLLRRFAAFDLRQVGAEIRAVGSELDGSFELP
jgi:hypothetical protein